MPEKCQEKPAAGESKDLPAKPPPQRALLIKALHDDGWTYKEIAGMLQTTPNSARQQAYEHKDAIAAYQDQSPFTPDNAPNTFKHLQQVARKKARAEAWLNIERVCQRKALEPSKLDKASFSQLITGGAIARDKAAGIEQDIKASTSPDIPIPAGGLHLHITSAPTDKADKADRATPIDAEAVVIKDRDQGDS